MVARALLNSCQGILDSCKAIDGTSGGLVVAIVLP